MYPSTQSIREIVSTHPSAIKIFQRFDIDLCSQADNSLERACAELQLSVDQVLEKLSDAESEESGATAPDPASLPLSRLIQHIVRVHHQNVRQELPRLTEMAGKVAAKRGDRAPELERIAELLEKLHAGDAGLTFRRKSRFCFRSSRKWIRIRSSPTHRHMRVFARCHFQSS
jgi:regulator of cell morphogenesis and NO signaling